MKFFVTGVGGQLGHDVMNELLKRGHEGVGSDIQETYSGVADGSAVTTGGTQNIEDVCKKLECKMTYISTDYVFDGQGTEPWQPDCKDYAVGTAVGSAITNKYRDIKDKKELKTLGTYSVTKDAEIKKIKLILKAGDRITVLAADDDSNLITKNGDKNNPYFVSADFLMGCSDYKEK